MARRYGYGEYGFRPYVSVAQRRAKAKRHAEQLAKKGQQVQPIEISGRKIATTFWGEAWCENLESYSDYANRLPRGRTYVRNGSVVDLQIRGGQVTAIVSGSEIYKVQIKIASLPKPQWKKIKQDCSQAIDSLMDLLQGRFSKGVMERLTRQREGLFPQPKEIEIRCSCPDWAVLCKHAAAVLYGVGARLDTDPEMLFQLREVDHLDLISQAVDGANLDAAFSAGSADSLDGQDLSDLFGIDLDADGTGNAVATKPAVRAKSASSKKTRSPVKQRSVGKNTGRKKKTVAKTDSSVTAPATKPPKNGTAKKKPSTTLNRSAKNMTPDKNTRRKKTAGAKSDSDSNLSAAKKPVKKPATKKQPSSAARRSAKKKVAAAKPPSLGTQRSTKKKAAKKKK